MIVIDTRMPESCRVCLCRVDHNGEPFCSADIMARDVELDSKPIWCPIIAKVEEHKIGWPFMKDIRVWAEKGELSID